jgi:hypothetical protein
MNAVAGANYQMAGRFDRRRRRTPSQTPAKDTENNAEMLPITLIGSHCENGKSERSTYTT